MNEQPAHSPLVDNAAAQQAIASFFADMASGRCPICHQPVAQQVQRGRCIYAMPCGHRLYQGKAKRS